MATVQQTVQTLLDKIQGKQGAGELSGEETLLLSKAVQSLTDNQQFEQALVAIAEQHLQQATDKVNAAKTQLQDVAQRVRSKDVGEFIQTSQDNLGGRKLLACDGSLPDFSQYPKLQALLPERLKLKSAVSAKFTNLTNNANPYYHYHHRARAICTVADGSKSFSADLYKPTYGSDDVYEIIHDAKHHPAAKLSVIYTINDSPSSGYRLSTDICCSDDGQHIYVLSMKWDGSKLSFTVFHSHNSGASFVKTDISGTPAWTGYVTPYGYSNQAVARIQCSANGEKVEVQLTPDDSVEEVFCARSEDSGSSFKPVRTPYGVLTKPGSVRCSYISKSTNLALVANANQTAQGQVYFSGAADQAFSDISSKMHFPVLLNDSWLIISDDDSTLLHLTQGNNRSTGVVEWEYSRDGGASFIPMSVRLNVPQDTSEYNMSAVLFDSNDANVVYIAVQNVAQNRNTVWAFYRLDITTGLNQCIANSVHIGGDSYTQNRWSFNVKRSGTQLAISYAQGYSNYTMNCLLFEQDKFLPEIENTRIIAE